MPTMIVEAALSPYLTVVMGRKDGAAWCTFAACSGGCQTCSCCTKGTQYLRLGFLLSICLVCVVLLAQRILPLWILVAGSRRAQGFIVGKEDMVCTLPTEQDTLSLARCMGTRHTFMTMTGITTVSDR